MHAVRPVEPGDVRAVVSVLARAFQDDPVSRFIFPDPADRLARLRRLFAIQLRHTYLVRGEAYTTVEGDGAAFWLPPVPAAPRLGEVLSQVLLLPLLRANLPRTLRLLRLLEERHPKERHYYLATLGTEPAEQGRGVGSALLEAVLARCDAELIPAYLESSKQSNIAFYARSGFAVTGEVRSPEGPQLWTMWRDPVPTRPAPPAPSGPVEQGS